MAFTVVAPKLAVGSSKSSQLRSARSYACAPVRVARRSVASRGNFAVRCSEGDEEIYLGEGKFIKDNPKKYANKENVSGFKGATGGWSGGEKALKEFAEQARQEGLGFVSGKGLVTSLEDAEPLNDGVPIDDKQKEIEKKTGKADGGNGWLIGATGGLAGGEVLLKEYLTEEIKREQAEKKRMAKLAALSAPKPPTLSPTAPLLMPGMNAFVSNTSHKMYGATGIVQRVTDGMVQVLFEGGNWDKTMTFELSEVEFSKKGPPADNCRSAMLELPEEKQAQLTE